MNDLISKCCNANYCKYSDDGMHCNADDKTIEECLYLKAISKIALLSMELTETCDNKS